MTLRELLTALLAKIGEIENLNAQIASAQSDLGVVSNDLDKAKQELAQQREDADHILRNKAAQIEELDRELRKSSENVERVRVGLKEAEGKRDAALAHHNQILDSIDAMKRFIKSGAA